MSITSESWWGREANPPTLVELGAKLRAHYKLTAGAIGIKGNTAHTYGYHRSANWVHNSAFSMNRTYSVVETPGNRNPADSDWCCALDVTLPRAELIAACQRLDEAVRAGRLEKVTEWYGNDDGDNRVDGYDNIRNRVASSDDSHLWHLHLSFDRRKVAENHDDVYEILTGDNMPTPEEYAQAVWDADYIPAPRPPVADDDFDTNPTWRGKNTLRVLVEEGRERDEAIKELAGKVDQVLAALTGVTLPPAGSTVSVTGTLELTPAPPA